jgi:hypothetical protein
VGYIYTSKAQVALSKCYPRERFGVDATQLTTWSADNHSLQAPVHVLNSLAMLRGERGKRRGWAAGLAACLPLRPADVAQRLALASPAAIRDAG